MGVTVIIGGAGVGKTSFVNARVQHLLRTEGQARLRKSTAKINKYNETRQSKLTPPDQIPVYTNFEAEYTVGYKKVYKPYFIDEEYFGMPNCGKVVVPVAPYSIIALDEMDEEYNSRKKTLSQSVSEMYNKRRHFGLEIFLILHRTMILDSIIREVTDLFIEIQKRVDEKNFAGRTIRTKWYCREFDDAKEMKRYVDTNGEEGKYRETVYVHEGNIFRCYDSEGCAWEFVPKEGEDFIYLKQRSEIDVNALPPEIAKYYFKGAKINGNGENGNTRARAG